MMEMKPSFTSAQQLIRQAWGQLAAAYRYVHPLLLSPAFPGGVTLTPGHYPKPAAGARPDASGRRKAHAGVGDSLDMTMPEAWSPRTI